MGGAGTEVSAARSRSHSPVSRMQRAGASAGGASSPATASSPTAAHSSGFHAASVLHPFTVTTNEAVMGHPEPDAVIEALRHELGTLKVTCRRQERELEQVRTEFAEAPRIIQNLTGELTAYKAKVKQGATQHSSDERMIMTQNERLNKLADELARAQEVLSKNNLPERNALHEEVEKLRREVAERAQELESEHRQLEMASKNAVAESQKLRAQLHDLKANKPLLLDEIQKLEATIKDKERVITQLQPYQYNALNNIRVADLACKVCKKRDKQDAADKARADAIAAIPEIVDFSLSVKSPTQLEVCVCNMDAAKVTAVQLFYSDSVNNLRQHEQLFKLNPYADDPTRLNAVLGGLEYNKTYFVAAAAMSSDLLGAVSPFRSVTIAMPLPALEAPKVLITFKPLLVQLELAAVPADVRKYADLLKIYFRRSDDRDEHAAAESQFLALIPASQSQFAWMHAQGGAFYSFAVSLVNKAGESALSPWTSITVADTVPLPPSSISASFRTEMTDDPNAPRNIKATVKFARSECIGSAQLEELQIFKTRMLQEGKGPDDLLALGPGVAGRTKFSAPSMDGTAAFVIDHLLPSQDYFFAGRARNRIGWSEWTNFNWARTEDLAVSVPPPAAPSFVKMSATACMVVVPQPPTSAQYSITTYQFGYMVEPPSDKVDPIVTMAGTAQVGVAGAKETISVEGLVEGNEYWWLCRWTGVRVEDENQLLSRQRRTLAMRGGMRISKAAPLGPPSSSSAKDAQALKGALVGLTSSANVQAAMQASRAASREGSTQSLADFGGSANRAEAVASAWSKAVYLIAKDSPEFDNSAALTSKKQLPQVTEAAHDAGAPENKPSSREQQQHQQQPGTSVVRKNSASKLAPAPRNAAKNATVSSAPKPRK